MNIVVSGSRVQIYGDEVQTYKQLPVGNYTVQFNPFQGFSLAYSQELEVKEPKIYGNTISKVAKCLDSFASVDRNFGIILSGQKGAGKSLFTRVLARSCIDRQLPVITVTAAYSGIANFISSIEQEVCVIFDEFDKTFFSNEDEVGPQSELLSLFDGLDNGKKLFVITCNSLDHLSTYLLDRPGRFHYHFTFGSPEITNIDEYLRDKLKPEVYAANRDRLMYYATIVDITYDYLRAICFELNRGYSLDDTLADLNIAKESNSEFDIVVTADINGEEWVFHNYGANLSFKENAKNILRFWKDDWTLRVNINPSNISIEDNRMFLKCDNISAVDNIIYNRTTDNTIQNFTIKSVEIIKSSIRYAQKRLLI